MPPSNNLGIRFEGPVLSGRMSTELAQQFANNRPATGERFRRMEDYDPVLWSHLLGPGKP